MSEPLPPAENVEDAMKRAAEAIRAMRHIPKDENAAQARVRTCAAIAAQRELAEAARRTMIDAVSAKRANGSNGAPPTGGELSGFTEKQVESVIKIMAIALRPHFDAYDKRLTELEARPVLSYEGVWSATKAYGAGAFVTHQGSLWHCEDTNVGVRPGSGSSSWKLAVKKGHAER